MNTLAFGLSGVILGPWLLNNARFSMEEGSMAPSTCNWHGAYAVAANDTYIPQWLPRQNRTRTHPISLSIVAIIFKPCEIEPRALELAAE